MIQNALYLSSIQTLILIACLCLSNVANGILQRCSYILSRRVPSCSYRGRRRRCSNNRDDTFTQIVQGAQEFQKDNSCSKFGAKNLSMTNSFNCHHLMDTNDPYCYVDNSIRDILKSNGRLQTGGEDLPPSLIKEIELGLDWTSFALLVNNMKSKYLKSEFVEDNKKNVESLPIDMLVIIANHCEDKLFCPQSNIGNLSFPIQGLLQLSKSEVETENAHIAVSTLISLNMLESSIRVLTQKQHGRAPLLKDMIELIGNESISKARFDNIKTGKILSSLLAPILRSLLLPNVGINLRNVLWHGFIGQIHRRWLALCIILTVSINQLTVVDDKENKYQDVKNMEASNPLSNLKTMRERHGLSKVLDYGHKISSSEKEITELKREIIASQFIPSSHQHLANLVLDCKFLHQYPVIAGAVLSLLIEHGLRIWWCDVNNVDEKVAKPISYYVTLDGNSQRDKHDVVIHPYLKNESKNKLVYELGGSCLGLLADLFASPPGGPNIRASIAHGLYDKFLHDELISQTLTGRQEFNASSNESVNDMTSALLFVLRVLTSKKLETKTLREKEIDLISNYIPLFSYSASMFDAVKNSMDQLESFRIQVTSDERIRNAAANATDKKQMEVTSILSAFDDQCMAMNLCLSQMILQELDVDSRVMRRWNDENSFHETESNKIASNCRVSILLLNEVAVGLKASHDNLTKAIKDCDEGNINNSRRRKQISRTFSMIPLTFSFYNVCILSAMLYIQKKFPNSADFYNNITEDTLLKAVKRSRMVASTFYTSTNTNRAIKSVSEYLAGKSINEMMKLKQE